MAADYPRLRVNNANMFFLFFFLHYVFLISTINQTLKR